ncbi:MAG: hypothetical protein JSV44_08775, partial [Candidatus Zixiibacteriota bacterium]
MLKRVLFAILTLGLLGLLIGCGEKVVRPDLPETGSIDSSAMPDNVKELMSQYDYEFDETAYQEWLSNLGPDAADDTGKYDIYSVIFLWGDLFNAADMSLDETDWSGTLFMNAVGDIQVRFIIDFEPGEDSLLPVSASTSVGWISYTAADRDGLNFVVAIRNDIQYFAAPYLTFETDVITLSFYFGQLEYLDAFYQTGPNSGVAVHAHRIWQNSCPGGLVSGRWIKSGSNTGSGCFTGFWFDLEGDTVGIMTGIFQPDSNDYGGGYFSGSVSGLYTDVVLLEFEGTWHYDDPRMCPVCGKGHGIFQGTFVDLTDQRTGILAGEFGDWSLPPNDIDMPMI